MASILLFRPTADAPTARSAPSGWPILRAVAGLIRRRQTLGHLRALSDRQLRDIGLERRDVADPLALGVQAGAWRERGSVGWAPR